MIIANELGNFKACSCPELSPLFPIQLSALVWKQQHCVHICVNPCDSFNSHFQPNSKTPAVSNQCWSICHPSICPCADPFIHPSLNPYLHPSLYPYLHPFNPLHFVILCVVVWNPCSCRLSPCPGSQNIGSDHPYFIQHFANNRLIKYAVKMAPCISISPWPISQFFWMGARWWVWVCVFSVTRPVLCLCCVWERERETDMLHCQLSPLSCKVITSIKRYLHLFIH